MNSPLCEADREIRRRTRRAQLTQCGTARHSEGWKEGACRAGRLAAGGVQLSGFEPHRSQVLQTDSALSQGMAVCLRPRFSFKICELRGLSSWAEAIRGKGLYLWWRTCCKRAWKGGRRGSLSSCESSGERVLGDGQPAGCRECPHGGPQRLCPLGNPCWPQALAVFLVISYTCIEFLPRRLRAWALGIQNKGPAVRELLVRWGRWACLHWP